MNQLKVDRLRALGFTGTLHDMEVKFYKSKGLTQTSFNDLELAYWKARGGSWFTTNENKKSTFSALGYTGTVNDMSVTALRNNTYYV